ncbi:MAG: IclR family transcriptional regulator [Actinomycetota bacterium]
MTTGGTNPSGPAAKPPSQTLDRGLRALEIVVSSGHPQSVADVADQLGLHRSIVYRMLRTLEEHDLIERDDENRFRGSPGLLVLARRVFPTLQSAALPELSVLANQVGKTAFLVVRHCEEAVTVAVVEPRHSLAHVAYRPGMRHTVDRGAPGLALLAGLPAMPGERPEVALCRSRGWISTTSEVLPGMSAVAAPVLDPEGNCPGAVAVVFVTDDDIEALGKAVQETARTIGATL